LRHIIQTQIFAVLFLRQRSNARDANGLAFASGNIFVAARTNQHRALRGLINPFARLVRLFVYFDCILSCVVFHIIYSHELRNNIIRSVRIIFC